VTFRALPFAVRGLHVVTLSDGLAVLAMPKLVTIGRPVAAALASYKRA